MAEAGCLVLDGPEAKAEEPVAEPACCWDQPAIASLTAGHFAVDFCQGMLPALLPYLVADGYSYQGVSWLVFAVAISSALVQPLFGHLCDRFSSGWLVPAGVLAAATITLAGLIGHYHLLMAFLLVSGLGVAAFHPEAARLINRAGGTRPGSAMSIFSVGGTAGFALAPILTAVIVSQAGKTGLLVVLVGVFVITAWLIAHLPRYQSLTVPSRARLSGRGSIGRDHWGPFAILGLSIGLRSTMFYGLMTFLALIWVQTYGQSKHAGNIALGLMLGSAVAGTLIGGWLSDRHGPLAVTRLGFVGTTVCLGLLCLASNAVVATLLLVPLGVVMALTGSPVVVLGQAYLPNRVGTASGVTIGLAVSVGGVVAPILGHWADTAGLGIIFPVVTGLAGLAAVLAYLLPQPRSS